MTMREMDMRHPMWAAVIGSAVLALAGCSGSTDKAAPATTTAGSVALPSGVDTRQQSKSDIQCAASDLKVGIPGWDAKQPVPSVVVAEIDFTNVSGRACTLNGFPGVALVDTAGQTNDFDREQFKPPVPVTVSAGQTVSAKTSGGLGVYDPEHPDANATSLTIDPARLLVTPPNTSTTVSFPWPWPGRKVVDLFGSTHARPYVFPVGVGGN
ncbi:DUF4232 domain-containing protein [Nocardia arthritidis]|nr:DUF4232 domain-containing protein [Nocardia arthritidis]